ncbi:hypothetical protein [Mycolicibacterium sp. 050158]|uniref:hypothetical protein n=1 Tax=Mycolicibacterium sp. 050158 TaxID=3090602 RepID=UPI00299E152C|nr:hypothetical protein [Mycolicibacterium sp. 050158]MDX1893416.1 hypothetical protein [Mycolicibacterium sp. 050158]
MPEALVGSAASESKGVSDGLPGHTVLAGGSDTGVQFALPRGESFTVATGFCVGDDARGLEDVGK